MFEHFRGVCVQLFKTENKFGPVKHPDEIKKREVVVRFGMRLEVDDTLPESALVAIEAYFPGLEERREMSMHGQSRDDQLTDVFKPMVVKLYDQAPQPGVTRRPLLTIQSGAVVDKIKCLVVDGTVSLEFKLEDKLDADTWRALYFVMGRTLYADFSKIELEAFDIQFAPQRTTGPMN